MKVLLDLNFLFYAKYSGIGRDLRNIFQMLAADEGIEITGMFYSASYHFKANYQAYSSRKDQIIQAAKFFHKACDDSYVINKIFSGKNWRQLPSLMRLFIQNKFSLYPVDTLFDEMLWREIFQYCYPLDRKSQIMRSDFCFSDVTNYHFNLNTKLPRPIHLNTKAFDVAFFPQVTPIRVSKNTRKLVRFHDAFPITHPQLTDPVWSSYFAKALQHCISDDSFFICDSEQARLSLLTIDATLEQRSTVIPCAVEPKIVTDEPTSQEMIDIINRRFSSQLTQQQLLDNSSTLDYVLSVGALEPRKNFITLIEAWKHYKDTHPTAQKLILVANPGWKADETITALLPEIQNGNVIHLANLTPEEMAKLYSNADLFIFPSLAEGFGYPPLEALQYGCPVLASDIPTIREICETNVTYFDPYNAEDLYDKLQSSFNVPVDNAAIAKFSLEHLYPEWQKFLFKS